MVTHACNLKTWEVQENQEFRVILIYSASLRPAWATETASKAKEKLGRQKALKELVLRRVENDGQMVSEWSEMV